MADLDALLADLGDETAELDAVVAAGLERADLAGIDTPTPAEGWTVRDQLSHLAGFDEAATTSMLRPAEFVADLERRIVEGDDPIAAYTARGRELTVEGLLEWWGTARHELIAAATGRDPRERVPWYGPPMSMMSFVSARLMETWAHGQDVRDAFGAPPGISGRLRHVAHIGVGARPFSYVVRGLDVPEAPVDVVLDAPDGTSWTWGPGDAPDRVSGPAIDFCLVVTQRRHRDDTALVVEGDAAEEWIAIAQAFAGAPGPGRAAGQFD